MGLSLALHNTIDKYNVLREPTTKITQYFKDHPEMYKVVLVVNHLFRAVAMVGLHLILPFSAPVNFAIGFAGSLFYRLTVETNCAYKFALPAFAGSLALSYAAQALTPLSLCALAAYATYVVLTVDYDVDHR